MSFQEPGAPQRRVSEPIPSGLCPASPSPCRRRGPRNGDVPALGPPSQRNPIIPEQIHHAAADSPSAGVELARCQLMARL